MPVCAYTSEGPACTPQEFGTDQKITGISPARVARDQEGSKRQGKGPSLNRRLAGQTLAHGGHVQFRAFCARHPLVLSRDAP